MKPRREIPVSQSLSKAFTILSATPQVPPDLFKTAAILSDKAWHHTGNQSKGQAFWGI